MYGLPHNYNPFSPHAPQKPPASPEGRRSALPLERLQAATEAGARWLSADGQRAYCERYGAVLRAEWDGVGFGSWFYADALPGDAVVLDQEQL